ncbi:MAG: hypothetical protein OEZ32_09600 [Nitrospinota bacterium]|nr:hypothetical protein [Nitrospinota bacterium]
MELDSALSGIPKIFRKKILDTYLQIKERSKKAIFDSSFDAAGLSSGKFSEAVFRYIQNEVTGKYIPFGKNISNFPDECRKIITHQNGSIPESIKIIMPRALVFLYTLRGKRGIGHVGGDIDANHVDAATISRVTDWIVCELIRVNHNLPIEEAQEIINALSTREIPHIWRIGNIKRVLTPGLTYKKQTLFLLYDDQQQGVLSEDLFSWVEHSRFDIYKNKVLMPLHKERLIEYDRDSEIVYISPLGMTEVQNKILPAIERGHS